MQLKNLSLTGADHTIPVEALLDAMRETKHVDFGILFSPKRPMNRYPSTEWLDRLTQLWLQNQDDMKSALYAHICGAWVTSLLKGEDAFFAENAECHVTEGKHFAAFTGFQLNIGKRVIEQQHIDAFIQVLRKYQLHLREWIIQIQVKRQNDFVKALRDAGINANPIYDKSGGKGVQPKTWAEPALSGYTGHAGGIDPYNWFTIAQSISAHPQDAPYWLDMESGLRDDETDGFDLRKTLDIVTKVKIMEDSGLLFK